MVVLQGGDVGRCQSSAASSQQGLGGPLPMQPQGMSG